MSKKNRERKSHNRERLRDLGIADSNLSRAQKRQLMRDMSSVPTLVEIREEVADYSAASIIAGLGSQKTLEPFVVSRLVHEAAQSAGATPISADQLRVLGSRLMQVADPELIKRAGTDLTDGAMARMLPQQLIGQSDFLADIHRVLAVLAPETETGTIGRAAWRDLLGMELTDLIVGVMGMSGLIGPDGTIAVARLAQLPETVGDIMTRSISLLSADLDGIRRAVSDDERRLGADVIRGLGPLVRFPIIRLPDDGLVVPSRVHLESALSTAGLYIRLIRADASAMTRERTEAAGAAFEEYLQRIAAESLPDGWVVTDLDEDAEPHASRADFLLIPPDGNFVLVVESKTTLQALTAQLRPWDDRSLVDDLYQRAFDQVDASAKDLAGVDIPVFGLVVTLDRHVTTRLGGRTYVGVPIVAPAPTTPAASSRTPVRVISAQDFEDLVEVLACGVEDPAAFFAGFYDDGSSMNATEWIHSGLPDEVTEDSLTDRLRVGALRRLASGVDDDAVRAAVAAALG